MAPRNAVRRDSSVHVADMLMLLLHLSYSIQGRPDKRGKTGSGTSGEYSHAWPGRIGSTKGIKIVEGEKRALRKKPRLVGNLPAKEPLGLSSKAELNETKEIVPAEVPSTILIVYWDRR